MTLLSDALDRALINPQSPQRWHALMATWLGVRNPADLQPVLDVLESIPADDPRADVLRLTFLAGATGEARFETAATARALDADPVDPDRLAALMAYQWLGALQTLETRSEFVATLKNGRVPEMALRLMQCARGILPADLSPRAPKAVERIAVVVPHVGNRFHTPGMMALQQCAVLAAQGRQVHIFSAQELTPPDAASYRGDGRELVLPPLDVQAWRELLPSGMKLTVGDERLSLRGRWRKLMPVVAAFDPDVVLLVGLYSPFAAALHTVRPTLGISVNTVAPIAPLDLWLSASQVRGTLERWAGVFPPPQVAYHPYRLAQPTQHWTVTRAELGLPESGVVWITAGFRLEHEIRGEWAQRMLDLLSRHPEITWLLVGGEGNLPPALAKTASGRIRALPTRNDLPGVLRCCDIYVNPPRMGGGFSVAEAMAEGLPVAAFAGSDGGDKIGDMAVANLDAYIERLNALTRAPALRREVGEALRRRFGETIDLAASGPALVAACERAATLARDRLTKPS